MMLIKRLKYLVLSLLLFAFGCKYFRGDQCNSTKPLVGVYKNIYDKEAKNVLQIFEDGSFEQTFTKGNIVKKNYGSWKRSNPKKCYVILDSLKLLHELPNSTKEYFRQNGTFRLNNIVFVEDFGYEFNYYRVDD